jgi:general secretion pathway protein A
MQYTVMQHKMGMVLAGECGVGKTFVSKVLMDQFFDGQCKFVYIPNPRLSTTELLTEMLFQLEHKNPITNLTSKTELLNSLKERLQFYKTQNLHVVIIIDDAQCIKDDDLLEEIRLLMNLHEDTAISFTLILSGHTQLMQKIDNHEALKQRLGVRYELLPLDPEDTIKYIEHRLEVTGIKRKIFTTTAYDEIQHISKGKPRVINNICDFALLTGFIRKVDMIDQEIIRHVATELGEDITPKQDV